MEVSRKETKAILYYAYDFLTREAEVSRKETKAILYLRLRYLFNRRGTEVSRKETKVNTLFSLLDILKSLNRRIRVTG
jgi:hypothetical protein